MKAKWNNEEWERKLMNMIRAQESELKTIFNEFVNASSVHLAKYDPPKNGQVWHRNKAIEARLNKELLILKDKITTYFNTQTAAAWTLSSEKIDALVSSYIKGMAVSDVVKKGYFDRNLKAYEAFRTRRVGDLSLSDRIWQMCEQSKVNLELYLQSGIGTGRSASQMSRDIRSLLNDPDKRFRRIRDENGKLKPSRPMANYHPGPGKYRSAYKNALRVTRTETNMAYRFADQARWEKLDFVKGFEVKLSASHPVYDICDEMTGAYPKTFSFGGWHPNCYCMCIPVLASEDEMVAMLNNDKPIGGHVKTIPPRAASHIRNNTKKLQGLNSTPYWLEDNFTLKNGKYVPKKALKVIPEGVAQTSM